MAPPPHADRTAALRCLERVHLLEKALRRVDNLSAGQPQRVGVARAMAQEPTLVLADEPVAGLDRGSADRVFGDFKRICAEDGITALVSLHHVEFARGDGDEIIAPRDGEVVFRGEPATLGNDALARIYEA